MRDEDDSNANTNCWFDAEYVRELLLICGQCV